MSHTTPCGPVELPTPAYPIYVIRIKRLLAMERMLTHEQLRDEEALVEWKAGDGHVLFASHTWLNHTHPDNERNEKLSLLKGWLGNILDGRAKDITPQWSQAQSGQGSEVKGLRIKAAKIRRDLLDGFVWLDLASIPQADCETQILAIQSIPHYTLPLAHTLPSSWVHSGTISSARRAASTSGAVVAGAAWSSLATFCRRTRSRYWSSRAPPLLRPTSPAVPSSRPVDARASARAPSQSTRTGCTLDQ